MRVTVRPRLLATHTAPKPVATPSGWASTSTELPRALARRVDGHGQVRPLEGDPDLVAVLGSTQGCRASRRRGILLVSVIDSGSTRLT